MQPRIEFIEEIKLIGLRTNMSIANNKTQELWKKFMPRRNAIAQAAGEELYSVQCYPGTDFFLNFNPTRDFEKWAAVKVREFDNVPDDMDTLLIPQGAYAVFHYIGKPSEAQKTYQYIFGEWIPDSMYALDDRPHFAIMGEKYLGEQDESEEEFWIPVRKK